MNPRVAVSGQHVFVYADRREIYQLDPDGGASEPATGHQAGRPVPGTTSAVKPSCSPRGRTAHGLAVLQRATAMIRLHS
jgi:hypothetical protein